MDLQQKARAHDTYLIHSTAEWYTWSCSRRMCLPGLGLSAGLHHQSLSHHEFSQSGVRPDQPGTMFYCTSSTKSLDLQGSGRIRECVQGHTKTELQKRSRQDGQLPSCLTWGTQASSCLYTRLCHLEAGRPNSRLLGPATLGGHATRGNHLPRKPVALTCKAGNGGDKNTRPGPWGPNGWI